MPKCGLSYVCLVGLLASLCLSDGCAQQGDKRFVYSRGTTPGPLIKVAQPGTYELFPDDALSPKYSIDLAAGDLYGFRVREDDAIVAVAKDKEIELGDRYVPFYYWIRRKATPAAPTSVVNNAATAPN